jgi:hypothetical protein
MFDMLVSNFILTYTIKKSRRRRRRRKRKEETKVNHICVLVSEEYVDSISIFLLALTTACI